MPSARERVQQNENKGEERTPKGIEGGIYFNRIPTIVKLKCLARR